MSTVNLGGSGDFCSKKCTLAPFASIKRKQVFFFKFHGNSQFFSHHAAFQVVRIKTKNCFKSNKIIWKRKLEKVL